eukprot:scaffold1066_cov115-Isochrysis_galbana.AAC.3
MGLLIGRLSLRIEGSLNWEDEWAFYWEGVFGAVSHPRFFISILSLDSAKDRFTQHPSIVRSKGVEIMRT